MSISVSAVKQVVVKNVERIQSLKDLAFLLEVNSETLRKDFAREERHPISDYIRDVRIRRAVYYLLSTNVPCKDVCFLVGFTREDVGARAFKAWVGMPMGKFRELYSEHAIKNSHVRRTQNEPQRTLSVK